MIEFLKDIDTSLFLFLNGLHNHFFDVIMYWVAYKYTWVPFYALLLWLVYKKFKRQTFYIMLAILVVIVLSDQLSVHLFKNVFERYRPCHNLFIQDVVHVVGKCGGMYGFVSSHAANTFALAIFLSLLFKQQYKRMFLVLLPWAALVSYSRIYNGVHYPADVVVGGMLGGVIALVVYKVFIRLNGSHK